MSVELSRGVLARLGCPNVRRGEGTDEWETSKGSYPYTPDLVAGPLVGGGAPSDFYIDVFAPSGDQYVEPRAGSPQAAETVRRAVKEMGSFETADLGDTHAQLLRPMNVKIAKYVGSRSNTPMFGLAMYFQMTGNQNMGPIVAAVQAPDTLDRAFRITAQLGPKAIPNIMQALLTPGESLSVLFIAIEQPLSFLLSVVEKSDGVRVLLLANDAIKSPVHPYASHPVISWLRSLRALGEAGLLLSLNGQVSPPRP